MTLSRTSRLLMPLLLLLTLLPQPTAAQSQRRWLADPELLARRKMIDMNGERVIQVSNRIVDMDLADEQTGWAIDLRGLQRFDGRFWRPTVDLGGTTNVSGRRTNLVALDLSSATTGWAVGTSFTPGGVNEVAFARLQGTEWTLSYDVLFKDGTVGMVEGELYDVAVQPDNTALAVGFSISTDGMSRVLPLVLSFDGTLWRDVTPAQWTEEGSLRSVDITGPGEAWVAGSSGEAGAQRPLLARVKDGVWTETTMPSRLEASQVIMRDASEGWAVTIGRGFPCDYGLLHYVDGQWREANLNLSSSQAIAALALIPGTNRGWLSLWDCTTRSGQRMRFDNGVLTPDPVGSPLMPTVYALLNEQVQWAASDGAAMRYSDERLPTERVADGGPGARYFPQTGHTLEGAFRQYYETHGLELGDRGVSERESLALFGYPLSQPFTEINPDTGDLLLVQYFERARFEYHPDNPDPYKVLLGRLGVNMLTWLNRTINPDPTAPPPAPECATFSETPFALCPPFRAFWERNGGLPVFGLPISPAGDETSSTDGQPYLTQWLERERVEYHPEHRGTPYEVQLGLLAAEELRLRGYIQ